MKKFVIACLTMVVLILCLSLSVSAYYTDIDNDEFYADGAFFCLYNGMICIDPAATQFSPSNNTSRGIAIYGITKALGLNLSNNVDTDFTDVPNGSDYAGPVHWASVNGVTSGIGNNLFGLGNYITRQQFCVFLYKSFKKVTNRNFPVVKAYPSFNDESSIESWAAESVRAICKADLMSGYSNGNFGPNDYITRGQAALVLFKLYSLSHYSDSDIKIFVRAINGTPLSGAKVFIYPYNQNWATSGGNYTYLNVTNSAGMINGNSVYNSYGVNTFRYSYSQGVSPKFINVNNLCNYPTTVRMQPDVLSEFIVPFKNYRVKNDWSSAQNYLNTWQNYGYRYGTNNQYDFHQGLDISSKPYGTAIYSVSQGAVIASGEDSNRTNGIGQYVKVCSYSVATGGYVYITYQHLSSRCVHENDIAYRTSNYTEGLNSGYVIGKVGNSGGNYGTHLHISFSKDQNISTTSRKYYDPIVMMRYHDASGFHNETPFG